MVEVFVMKSMTLYQIRTNDVGTGLSSLGKSGWKPLKGDLVMWMKGGCRSQTWMELGEGVAEKGEEGWGWGL